MRMSLALFFAVASIAAVTVISTTAHAQPQRVSGSLSPAEQDGQRVFQTRCAMCHVGATVGAEGRTPASTEAFGPRLSKVIVINENTTREKIRSGGPRMPGYQWSLQTEQIDHVIAYLKTVDAPMTRIFSPVPGE
jgi:mono/diheme cytochrome c family protein